MKIIYSLILLLGIGYQSNAQWIASGPMLGYSDYREVLIWIQTTKQVNVQARYFALTNPNTIYKTTEIITQPDKAFTAKLIADQIVPGQTYQYEILINGKVQKLAYPLQFTTKALWQYRNEAPDIKFALGSCGFVNDTLYDRPGEPYGANYEIFEAIASKKPDFMLWLGDNVYYRDADWSTYTGIYHRYSHYRRLPALQHFLASTHHYAIWDDHDYGPNDSDRSFIHKDKTLEAFKLFWGNPTFGTHDMKGAISSFQWSDCEFFMLDNRYYRSPNQLKSEPCAILGSQQLQWLIDALSYSKATFKFIVIGGQVLNPHEVHENFIKCPAEYNRLLNALSAESIPGVVFLTGDRHFSELTYYKRSSGYTLYDFTVSPLLSKAYCPYDYEEKNGYPRVENSLICNERNFGIIEISGMKTSRQAKFVIYDANGKERFGKVIYASELK